MQIARITVATLSGNFWKPFTALHLSPKEIGVKQLQSFIPTVHNRILIWKIKREFFRKKHQDYQGHQSHWGPLRQKCFPEKNDEGLKWMRCIGWRGSMVGGICSGQHCDFRTLTNIVTTSPPSAPGSSPTNNLQRPTTNNDKENIELDSKTKLTQPYVTYVRVT